MAINEKIRDHYSNKKALDTYVERVFGLKAKYFEELELRVINKYFIPYDKPNILDLGMGNGRFIPTARKYKLKYFGIEYSTILAVNAIENYLIDENMEDVRVFVGDAFKSPLKGDSFDNVVSIGMLEYVKNIELFLEEVERLIRKDGKLVFTAHNKSAYVKPNFKRTSKDYELAYFSSKELSGMLKRRGWSDIKITSIFHIPGRHVWHIYNIIEKLTKCKICLKLYLELVIFIQKALYKIDKGTNGTQLVVSAKR